MSGITLPESFFVGYAPYTVSYEEDPALEDVGLCGMVDHGARRIRVRTLNQHPAEVVDTVIHELIHALDPKLPEKVVDGLAPRLTALFATNPDEVIQLVGALRGNA